MRKNAHSSIAQSNSLFKSKVNNIFNTKHSINQNIKTDQINNNSFNDNNPILNKLDNEYIEL